MQLKYFRVYDQSRLCIHIVSIHALRIRNVSHFLYIIRWNILRCKKIFFFFFFNRSISNDTGLTISSISLIREINHHDFQIHCVYRDNWQHRRKIIVPWKSCLTTFKRASLFIMAIYVHDIFNSCLERSIYPYPDQWLINQYFLSIRFITITIINSFSYLSLHRGKRLLVNV